MKQDRFLIGILVGVGALVVLALVLFFIRRDNRDYQADNNPEGVVHNYILAILNKDYEKAYSYLAEQQHKPTYEDFRQSFFNGMVNPNSAGAEVGTAEINGDEAIVHLTLYYSSSDPFSSRYSNEDRVLLVKQNGEWKLSSMQSGNYWDYNWYQEPFKP
jgi:hypothetical protein